MGQTAIRHNTAHIGEGVTIRGLGGFGLGGERSRARDTVALHYGPQPIL